MPHFLLALTAAVALALPLPAQAQISVGSLVRMMETRDGRGTIEITIRNNGEDHVDVGVVLQDWSVDSAGNHTFRPAGTLPGSCGARLATSDRELRLEPRSSRVLRVDFAGGESDRCRNIVFFRVAGTADEIGGDQLIISHGVKVYVGPREQP